jgi:uncharacterized protein YbjT (DUF2867 family)
MKVAVTTPTGNVGSVVAKELLTRRSTEVVLLARDSAKIESLVQQGGIVFEGSLDDRDFVMDATRGVDLLFWVTPPSFAENHRAFRRACGENAAAAVKANRIQRVVDISSVGAHLESGTGPILELRHVEKQLEKVAPHVTHLRPHMFMENFFASLDGIQHARSVFLPVPGSASALFIASRDIGEYAAERILDASWSGRRVVELVGPERLTFDAAAAILSDVLGEKIGHVQVTPDATREALRALGFADDAAAGILEIYESTAAGRLEPEGQPKSMKTKFAQFVKEALLPRLRGGVEGTAGKA